MTVQKSPGPCGACGIKERTSYHFGTTSCAACASFFRRTVALGIRYLCNANDDCLISPEIKFNCRSCRFNRCLAAGMLRDQVQQKKTDLKVPKYVLESRRLGISDIVRCYATSSGSGSVKSDDNTSDESVESSRSNSPRLHEFSSILNATHDELLQYYVRQVQQSISGGKFDSSNFLNVPNSFLESKKISDQLALEICHQCPGTDLLETADLEVLFRYCSFSNLWMDSAWAMVKYDGTMGCGDMNAATRQEIQQDDKISLFHTNIQNFHSTIICELSRLQLDVIEYAALKSFCIWKIAFLDSTLTLKIVAQEQYIVVSNALNKYYELDKKLSPDEVATRFAEIMLFLGSVFNVYQDVQKMYSVLEIENASFLCQ